MPPASGTTPITPSPAHMTTMNKKPSKASRWGSVLLILIVASFTVSAFVNNWNGRMTGTVSVIVRDAATGGRVINTLDLASASLTALPNADPNTLTTVSARTFSMSDGSTIGLDTAGVIRRQKSGPFSVLVASTVAPLLRTPLSVWGDGSRIAWVNPADASVQVYYRSDRGAYVPTYLNNDIHPNSLGFSSDGAHLVVTVVTSDKKTDVFSISMDRGVVTKVTTIDGLAFITPTP